VIVILTVTLNFALDVTYGAPRIRWRSTNRVSVVGRRAGGKGVNVARVLHALGRDAVVTGLAGGATGAAARAELERSGLIDATVSVRDRSRVTIVVVERDGEVTGFSEPGPEVTGAEWARLQARLNELLGTAEAVVLSGSLPPGVPLDAYAQLTAIAQRAGVPVLLDAEGEALARGVAAGPQLVKINARELEGFAPGIDVLSGAAQLRAAGAGAVVVSEGPAGLVGLTEAGAWRAVPPRVSGGNPTGAGDAAAAALVAGMVDAGSWPRRLSDAAALSAAAVTAPMAGSFDEFAYRRLSDEVVVHELQSLGLGASEPRREDSTS
jgi:tagatose 6-phosphate kinase